MTLNDLKGLQMSLCVSNKLSEVIWDHLELFKSWGDKISYTINMQRCSKMHSPFFVSQYYIQTLEIVHQAASTDYLHCTALSSLCALVQVTLPSSLHWKAFSCKTWQALSSSSLYNLFWFVLALWNEIEGLGKISFSWIKNTI